MTTDHAQPQLEWARILSTSREMVVAGGLEALSVRKVAARLGVTAPALYGYMSSKRDLLRALAEEEFGLLLARFEAVEATDPVERMRALSKAYVAHARENPGLFEVMLLFAPSLGGVENLAPGLEDSHATRTFSAAAEAVEEAIASGAIDADDPRTVTLVLWSAVHGLVSILGMGFGFDPEYEDALVDEVIDRVLAGYGV